ncbi:hypothetical protein BV378_14315 [Nostoc sp. RF31YmG]|nr:hypothetical protein BV378_14315 [Nostoc sp. RF31YmG]
MLRAFPALKDGFATTSPKTHRYNCIAWAANDDSRWWWPQDTSYWPVAHTGTPSVDAFHDAFFALGYDATPVDASLEAGFEKVAIYVSPQTGLVTHMARQLRDGSWTSKLGPVWDISHVSPECLDGDNYGKFTHCLKRPLRGEG